MAFTFQEEVSNGVQTVYPVDFDFRDTSTVYVYTGAHSDYGTQISYRWITGNQEIELLNISEVPSGTKFYIRRIVPRDDLVHKFVDRSIRGRLVDEENYHLLYLVQEFMDGFLSLEELQGMFNDLDMQGNLIKNLGDAVDDTDAVNLRTVQTLIAVVKGANFVQEEVPTVGLAQGVRWYKASVNKEYIYYIGPNGVGVWTETSDVGDNTEAGALGTNNGGTVQNFIDGQNFETVAEAVNYSAIAGLYGLTIVIKERDKAKFKVVKVTELPETPQGLDMIATGNPEYALWLQENLSKPRCEAFGASTTADASTNTAAINRAMELCYQNGGGTPTIDGGVVPYRVNGTLTLYRKVILKGTATLPTEIFLEAGTNKDMVKTENFDALTGTGDTTTNPLCPYAFGAENITFNGNAVDDPTDKVAPQTLNNSAGVGIRMYGPRPLFKNVTVYNTYSHGIYSEYSGKFGSSSLEGQEEGKLEAIICRDSYRGRGWLYRGPHNTVMSDIICCYNWDLGFENQTLIAVPLQDPVYDGNISELTHLHTYANSNNHPDTPNRESVFGSVTNINTLIVDGGYSEINASDCQISTVKLIFGGQSNHGVIVKGDHNNIGMFNGSMLKDTAGYDVLRIEGDNNYVGRARINGQTSGANNHDGAVITGTGNTIADLNARSCFRGCVVTGGLNTVKGKLLLCTDSFSYSTPTGTHAGKNRIDLEIFQTSGRYTIGDRPVDQVDQFNIQGTGMGNKRCVSEVESDPIALDVTTVQNVVIPHNLLYTPTRKSVSLTLLSSTPADAAVQPHQMFVSAVDATNITVAFRMQTAAATDAKGRIGVKVKI